MASTGVKGLAVFFVFFLVTQTNADRCSAGCSGAQPKDGFIQGHTYTYSLEGLANIQLSSAPKKEATVKLTAQTTVVALGNCANLLKVTSVAVDSLDGSKFGKPVGLEKPVRFTLQDGVLGSDICAEAGDSQWSLNIKRAILSLLQTATKYNTEVDIFGVCPTTFISNSNGPDTHVHKTRDLNACAHREQGKQDLLTYIYNPSSEVKNSNILKSSMRADVSLKAGIVDKAEVQEDYLYRPFSNGEAGLKGSVNTKLILRETNRGNLEAKCVVPKSIIYENPHQTTTEASNVANLQFAINAATESLKDHVKDKSASIFASVIRVMRESKKADIMTVYGQLKSKDFKDNELAKKVFLDALFRAGTGDSVEVSIELLVKKELTPFQEKLVLISLTNVRHASSESLSAVCSLLDVKGLPNEVYLGAGALGGAYCREHTCHGSGSQDAGVAALTNKLASKIGSCKANSKKEEDVIVAALKGLRNIGHLEDSVVDKLGKCASDPSIHQRVRVAALETFAGDACISKLKNIAIDILKDRQQDSEVRIKAFLALMECPCNKVGETVRDLLADEPVYQVGSFLTSYIRNVRASANSNKDSAKRHLEGVKFVKKYPLDGRRFSQNYEASYEIDALGIGSFAESNVIFSQDSFLPRSASLNLTTEIFGRQINLIELGVRQGNLDRVIEHYFGPHGEVLSQTPQQLYSKAKSSILSIMEKVQQRLKGNKSKRDVQKQIAAFGSKLKTDIPGFSGNLDLDIFVKLFGTESIFLSLEDDKAASFESLIDKLFDCVDTYTGGSKTFADEIRSHIMFLDMELAYPTASGLSLKLKLEGAATSKLNFGGNIDLKKIIQDPVNAKVELNVIPSANVEITGSLAIDADTVVSGLKVIGNMHTSTGSQIQLKLSEKGFTMLLGLPVEKQEIISVSTEIYFFKRFKGSMDTDTFVKTDQSAQKFEGCFDQLSAAIGLTACVEFPMPNDPKDKGVLAGPLFPFNRNMKASLRLEKDDLKGFNIHGKSEATKDKLDINFVMETIGKKPRKVSFDVLGHFKSDLASLALIFDSPIKKLSGEVALVSNNKEMSVKGEFKMDQHVYSAKAGIITQSGNTYKPIIELVTPEATGLPISIDGTVSIQKAGNGKKFTSNSLCLIMGNERIVLDGFVSIEPKKYKADLKLSHADQKGVFKGEIATQLPWTKVNAEFTNTINPNINFLLDIAADDKPEEKTLELSLVHGKDLKSTVNRVSYNAKLKGNLDSKAADLDFTYTNKFSYPAYDVKFATKIEGKPKAFELDFTGDYKKVKGEFELELKNQLKKEGDLYGKIKLKIEKKGFALEGRFDEETKTNGKFFGKLELYPSNKYELSGALVHKLVPKDYEVGVSAVYKQQGKPNEVKIDFGVVMNDKTFSENAKLCIGSTDYLDTQLTITKEDPNYSGSLKLFLKDIVDANGQFKASTQDKGNALLIVNLLKVGRKIKFDSKFDIHIGGSEGPNKININLDIFPNFEKDKSKVTISTNTKVQQNFVDSKNILTVNGEKTEVHYKHEANGQFDNGSGKEFVEIFLANGKSLVLSASREGNTKDNIVKGSFEVNAKFINGKGQKPNTLNYKAKLNSMNKETKQADAEHHLVVVKSNGEDLDLKLAIKVTPKKDRKQIDLKLESTGAMCKQRTVLTVTHDYLISKELYDGLYRVKGTYGDQNSLDLSGAYEFLDGEGDNVRYKNDADLHLIVQLDKLHDIKFVSKDYINCKKGIAITSLTALTLNGDIYKYDAAMNMGPNNNIKLSALVPKQPKVTFSLDYKPEENEVDKTVKHHGSVSLEYGKGQHLKMALDGVILTEEGRFSVVLELPEDAKSKKIVTNVSYKKPSNKVMASDISVDVDGKKYTLNSDVDMSQKDKSVVDFKASYPEGKPARVYMLGHKTGENHFMGDLKLENLGDFNMVLNVDSTFHGPENFKSKITLDCAKLKKNKAEYEVYSNPPPQGPKIIYFSAVEDGKNVINGEITYHSEQKGNKYIMEGTGTWKILEQPKAASFKFIREKLVEGPETGVEVFYKYAVAEKSVVVEYKNTNLEYKLSTVYCEEKKQCANIEINNKLDIDTTQKKVTHNLEFSFDLRKLGFAPEFGLQSSTELERFKMPVHSLEIHLNHDKTKYHMQVFAKPVHGDYKTAAILTTPQRIISLETSTTYPEVASKVFPLHHETVFFFNKNDPNTKTQLKINSDYQKVEKKTVTSTGEIIFSSPALGKDLLVSSMIIYDIKTHMVSADVVLDIFKKKDQKIVATMIYHPEIVMGGLDKFNVGYGLNIDIVGKGCGFEMSLDERFELNKKNLKFKTTATYNLDGKNRVTSFDLLFEGHHNTLVIKVPTKELLNFECKCSKESGLHKTEGSLKLLQDKTYSFSSEINTSGPFSITVDIGPNPHDKVIASAVVKFPYSYEANLVHFDGKAKAPLIHMLLDFHGKKPDTQVKVSNENVKPVVEKLNNEVKNLMNSGSELVKELGEAAKKDFAKLKDNLNGVSPDLQHLLSNYQSEAKKIAQELEADKAIIKLPESVQNFIKSVVKIWVDISERLIDIINQTNKAYKDATQQLNAIWNEKVLPELTNTVEKLSNAALQVFASVFEVISHYVVVATEFIEKNMIDVKPLITSISGLVTDILSIVQVTLIEIQNYTLELFSNITKQIAELPAFVLLKEKLQEHKVSETISEFISNAISYLKDASSQEGKEFWECLNTYIGKKFTGTHVDDLEQLTLIFNKAIAALDALWKGKHLPSLQPTDPSIIPLFGLSQIPLQIIPDISIVNYFKNPLNLPTPMDYIKSYWPNSCDPADIVPPYKMKGIVAGGQHIFTFDGRHMTFPGSCRYVLAQDAVDGNFSIILNLEKGVAKSIVLSDKSGNAMEVNNNLQLQLNGQNYGFPVMKSDTVAWKEGHTFTLQTNYGAKISCSHNLDLCYVEVSGFYHGKLRGLLGDGNREPYDDFRLPNGKISTSESDFGNAYALVGGCQATKTVDHAMHEGHHAHGDDSSSDICNKIFNSPSLGACNIAVDVKNYKQACQHATASAGAHAKQEACLIARAYVLACRKSTLPVFLPDECAQCTLDEKTNIELGQKLNFKLPLKQADIVLAVETTKENEKTYKELVVPMISALVDDLKSKKIDNIKVHLVGISPKLAYPIFYDTENVKLKGAKIEFIDEPRSAAWESPIAIENYEDHTRALYFWLKLLSIELGVDNFHISYTRLGQRINWRPKAVKTIIMVNSEVCKKANIPLIQMLGAGLSSGIMEIEGIVTHLIAPLNMTADGVNENTLVGHSEKHVFVMGDKKRGLSHSDLRKSIAINSDDQCTDYSEETNGNTYSSAHFSELNAGQRKTFVQLVSQTISDSMCAVTHDVSCKCLTNFRDITPNLFCSVDNRKDNRKPVSGKK